MSFRIIDGFLTKTYADFLEEKIGSHDQPWFYMNDSTDTGSPSNKLRSGELPSYSFAYNICSYERGMIDSPISNMMLPFIHEIMDVLDCHQLLRCRLDMTMQHPAGIIHTPHRDLKVPHVTCIYYVNDSDGDTVIYNEKRESKKYTEMTRVSPTKNRLLIFDGDLFHTGHSPVKHRNRILINTNFAIIS